MPSITRRYGEKLFTFEVDILRTDVCDISLNLQLTERVLVSTDGSVSSVEGDNGTR
ncbi:phage tail protein [Escherichia coli]